jgi:hypothetical protein
MLPKEIDWTKLRKVQPKKEMEWLTLEMFQSGNNFVAHYGGCNVVFHESKELAIAHAEQLLAYNSNIDQVITIFVAKAILSNG